MFGDLFEEDDGDKSGDGVPSDPRARYRGVKNNLSVVSPPCPRGYTGLCGLRNQGGTCYLNSLIQTLFLTPEFREGLFKLDRSELGDVCKSGIKARVIPLQLQRLFAKLLLLDQESVSTAELTDSFGWSSTQAFQQHDVQELNRILFSALESSMVATAGENLIRTLYHGTSVTQIVCKDCHKVSEREEDFLDLQMVLTGCRSLEQSLQLFYVAKETLDGGNQYKCEACNKLVDATRAAKLRSLPPILTFSLLRFTYDMKSFDRIKETKRYVFPLTLDMRPFCEAPREKDVYELYSVVVHRGSCYGGHYHAYIKDVQGLGTWTPPDEEEVKIKQTLDGQEGEVSCSNPIELVSALLQTFGSQATVEQLCQSIAKETGMSWNKRYKRQYGPLNKFLAKYPDAFSVLHGVVTLIQPLSGHQHGNGNREERNAREEKEKCTDRSSLDLEDTAVGESVKAHIQNCWFDFNDKRVRCIDEADIQQQFSGRESAYMLFYLRKNLKTHGLNKDFSFSSIPSWLVSEVEAQNTELNRARAEYDMLLNRTDVTVHFSCDFTVSDGILSRKQGLCVEGAVLTVDRRKPVRQFAKDISELCNRRGMRLDDYTIHIARTLPAGLHLYDNLTGKESSSLVDCGVCSGSEVFVWDGKKVDGSFVSCGPEHEPILLCLVHQTQDDDEAKEIPKAFAKSTTLKKLKGFASLLTGIKSPKIVISAMNSGECLKTEIQRLGEDKSGQTLNALGLKDGQRLVVEKRSQPRKAEAPSTLADREAEKCNNLVTLLVENRCVETESGHTRDPSFSASPDISVQISKDKTLFELKCKILSSLSLQNISEDECILRGDATALGLGPPLFEHERVDEAWFSERHKLVLGPGTPLLPSQIAVRYYILAAGHSKLEREFIVNKTEKVGKFLRRILEMAGLEGLGWHLRKTNWFGEIAELLENEDTSLEDEGIKNGDTVVIEEGRVPPKGFLRLSLWLVDESEIAEEKAGGVLSWITSGLQGLLTGTTQQSEAYRENELVSLGEVELSQDITLSDLKMHILHMEQLKNVFIPSPELLRVQEIINGYPGRVLRKPGQTLRYLKLTSSSKLSVQVLTEEEIISQSATLLNVWKRVPGARAYKQQKQVIFDPKAGATPSALRQFICDKLGLNEDTVVLAKYFRQKFDWLVISESLPATRTKPRNTKKSINLRHAPYRLQDGDVIGVKEAVNIDEDDNDFSTPEDDEGRNRLRLIEEERIRRRREKRAGRSRQPEAELRIHVDDFR